MGGQNQQVAPQFCNGVIRLFPGVLYILVIELVGEGAGDQIAVEFETELEDGIGSNVIGR